MPPAGRVLAIDPGSRRVGLALSDESRTIASPRGALAAEPRSTLAERVARSAREADATAIVVGLPRLLNGAEGEAAAEARELARSLRRATGLPVTLVDERMTSAAAERHLVEAGVSRRGRRQVIDGVAAAMILQTFLERDRVGR